MQAECTVAPSSHGAVQRETRARRGHSLPPATTSTKSTTAMHQQQTTNVVKESDQAAIQEDLLNCAAGKKRSYSETNSDSESITGRRRHSQAGKDNLKSALTTSSGRTSSTMTTAILDAINESNEDQLENDTSSQESMDYRQYQKATIITSSRVGGGAGIFSNNSDSSDNSDSDMVEIVQLKPAPKQKRPQGKKSAQQKPLSRKKIKPDDSDEELDTSDSDSTTCGV